MNKKSAFKSKTIRFNAILVAVIGILQGLGVDVPEGVYVAIAGAGPLLNIILRFITKGAITLSTGNNQSGRVVVGALIFLCLFGYIGSGILIGCAGGKTATQQIYEQTSDPYKIGRALYLDALWSYEKVAGQFDRYQSIIKLNNPELHQDARKALWQANEVLRDIKKFADIGAVSDIDADGFDRRVENIIFLLIDYIE